MLIGLKGVPTLQSLDTRCLVLLRWLGFKIEEGLCVLPTSSLYKSARVPGGWLGVSLPSGQAIFQRASSAHDSHASTRKHTHIYTHTYPHPNHDREMLCYIAVGKKGHKENDHGLLRGESRVKIAVFIYCIAP